MRAFWFGALCGVGAMAVAAAGLAELWARLEAPYLRKWSE